jgi:hypothetical protein
VYYTVVKGQGRYNPEIGDVDDDDDDNVDNNDDDADDNALIFQMRNVVVIVQHP